MELNFKLPGAAYPDMNLRAKEFLSFPRQRPGFWLVVMVLYPVLSADAISLPAQRGGIDRCFGANTRARSVTRVSSSIAVSPIE
ncbi:hypothetical protein [Paraburkholderia rhizosphaerae]|uniref:hypothetical protein n=1 Tax=Paraburkholderia rhizosphaerae TaxID=480658 RepID=UPI00106494B7|nr:hypothetical protein [Paraburkholderia rhizosphaerae]